MRWEDESYIRWYRRNTPEWCLMSWQARGLFGLILREVDRAGILELGKLGLKAVAVAVRAPWDEIEKPLVDLIEDGCLVHRNDLRIVLVPNFIAAQEANASDKARQRASRERARDLARALSLDVLGASQNGVSSSPSVTKSHPHLIRSDPNQSHPNPNGGRSGVKADQTSPEAQRPDPPDAPKSEPAFDMAQRLYTEFYSKRYGVDFMLTSFGHKGSDEWAFVNVARLAESKGETERWLRHWMRSYLRDDEKWLVDNRHPPRQLEKRINKYGEPKKAKPPLEPKVEPPTLTRPVTILQPVNEPEPERKPSTPAELAEKSRAAKLALAAFGNGKP